MERISNMREPDVMKEKEGARGKKMRKNLKEARQKAGMTQQEMADAIYVNLNYYQKK